MTGGYRWKKDRCSNCGKGVVAPVTRTIQAHWCLDKDGKKYWRDTVQGSAGMMNQGNSSFQEWLTKDHSHTKENIEAERKKLEVSN